MTETSQKPSGKGKPTPKRSEAEKARRKPIVAPRGRSSSKEDRAELRRKMRDAMRGGDERYLPPIAAGPERALVRDVVDARRSFAWWSLPGWAIGLVLGGIKTPATQAAGSLALVFVVFLLIADSLAVSRAVRKKIAERFPGTTMRGLTYYAVARNMQPRRWRRPPPRVVRGAEV